MGAYETLNAGQPETQRSVVSGTTPATGRNQASMGSRPWFRSGPGRPRLYDQVRHVGRCRLCRVRGRLGRRNGKTS